MIKENANPIIYQVTSPNEVESESNVASRILKRWTHHSPDQEEEEELLLLEQQQATSTAAGRNSAQTSSSSSSFPYYYDSLYHLEPHRYLTPSERSIQSALASIEESFCKRKGSKEGPLDIFRLAGIKTATKNQAAGRSISSSSSAGMYFFKPSDAAISQQQQKIQQQQQEWDTITQREVFDMIRNIQDPEHPLTLEQLNVVNCSHISVTDNQYSSITTVPTNDINNNNNNNTTTSDDHDAKKEETIHSFVHVKFTPTIPHCSMATLIGLCIRVKLLRSLPKRFKVTVRINPGTHASEVSINRQLNDKERVIAAMENVHLLSVVNKCIANGMQSSA